MLNLYSFKTIYVINIFFPFFLYVSPTDWPIKTLLCTQRDTHAKRACLVGSSGYTLRAGCTLAHGSCLPKWLLALSGLLGLSGSDLLSEEVALSTKLQFMNPLPGLCYNSTQNITRITLKVINFSIFWIRTKKKLSSYCFNTK